MLAIFLASNPQGLDLIVLSATKEVLEESAAFGGGRLRGGRFGLHRRGRLRRLRFVDAKHAGDRIAEKQAAGDTHCGLRRAREETATAARRNRRGAGHRPTRNSRNGTGRANRVRAATENPGKEAAARGGPLVPPAPVPPATAPMAMSTPTCTTIVCAIK